MTAQVVVVPDAESAADAATFETLFQELGEPNATLRVYLGAPIDAEQWRERLAGVTSVILNWKLPDHALRDATSLRNISFLGTGAADHVNLELARELGVSVRTVSGYSNDAVAEHTIGLLLAVARDIPGHNQDMHRGVWNPGTGTQLSGKRLGLIGYGSIGRRVAELGSAFGMDVVTWTRSGQVSGPAKSVTLDELLTSSDVVSVHLSLVPETEGIVGEVEIGRLRKGAIFINTARGALVDERALVAALDSGDLLGAGVDVFLTEPAASDDPLACHPRVVATPHIGFATADAETELLRRGVANALLGSIVEQRSAEDGVTR